MRRNGYLGTSDQKTDPPFAPATSTSYKTSVFPLSDDVFCIYLMFCAQFSFDLVTLTFRPFDLGGVWRIKSLIRQTYLLILSFLRLSVSELCVTQSDRITITWNGHCACAVSRDLSLGGGETKMIHIFEIPDPNLPIHFVTFRELRRRLSHVIREQ